MIAARYHQRLSLVHDDIAESKDIGAHDRRLARHRLEQCDAERRLRRWARVHGAVRVIARPALEHRADEDDVRIATREAIIVIAQGTVSNDDELRAAGSAFHASKRLDEC